MRFLDQELDSDMAREATLKQAVNRTMMMMILHINKTLLIIQREHVDSFCFLPQHDNTTRPLSSVWSKQKITRVVL